MTSINLIALPLKISPDIEWNPWGSNEYEVKIMKDFTSLPENAGVFVTGATGFIGSNLVLHLLQENGNKIFCLVRPMGNGRERLIKALLKSAGAAGLTDRVVHNLDNVVAIEGDLTRPLLGMSTAGMKALQDAEICHVWHCGASLRYEEKYYDEICAQNIQGTQNTVEVAAALGVPEFNYVSTAYVAGEKEGNIGETFYDPSYAPNNCYEESKRRAEDAVIGASLKGLFRLRIFRPSIVIGNTTTYDSTSSSGYYGFVHALERYLGWIRKHKPDRLKTIPTIMLYREEGAELNLMPVDILVREALALSCRESHPLEIHHLTNPFPLLIDEAISAINAVYEGLELKGTGDLSALNELDSVFKSKIDFYNPYLMNKKRFERRTGTDMPMGALDFDIHDMSRYTNLFLERQRAQRE
jgi:thioester reductase-like protein